MKRVVILLISVTVALTGCGLFDGSSQNKDSMKLYYGLINSNYQALKECMNKEIDLENLDEHSSTCFDERDGRALGIALDKGADKDIIGLLLKAGADVNSISGNGETYLQQMAYWGEYDICKYLIEEGADVNLQGEKDYSDTALEYMLHPESDTVNGADGVKSDEAYKETIELFLDSGTKVNKKTLKRALKSYYTYVAAPIILEELKQKGAKTGISKDLEYAISGDNEKLIKRIKENKYNVKEQKRITLYAAAYGSPEVMETMEKEGFEFTVKDANGKSLLHIAAQYNSSDVVEFYLDQGLKIEDSKNMSSYTPLTCALISNNLDAAALLVERGAKYQGNNEKYRYMGETLSVFGEVCAFGDRDSIEFMLANGCEPYKDEIYEGYRNTVINDNGVENLQCLIDNGISFEVKISGTDLIFEEACLYDEECATVLYEAGAAATDMALINACESRYNKLAERMIEEGQEINCDVDGDTPLMMAIISGDFDMVKYLIDKGADINKKSEYGSSAMHIAAENPSTDILKYLIKKGGKVNAKDDNGER